MHVPPLPILLVLLPLPGMCHQDLPNTIQHPQGPHVLPIHILPVLLALTGRFPPLPIVYGKYEFPARQLI